MLVLIGIYYHYNARGLNIPYIRLNRTHLRLYHHPSR